MFTRRAVLLMVTLALVLRVPLLAKARATSPPLQRTIESQPDGLVVHWQTAPAQFVALPNGMYTVRMEGFTTDPAPGRAQLPQDALLVALPPDAQPRIEVVIERTTRSILPGPLRVTTAQVELPGGEMRQIDTDTDRLGSDRPAVVFEEIGIVRGVRLARLVFHPVRVDGDQIETIQSLRVTLDTTGSDTVSANAHSLNELQAGPPDLFLESLARQVINPEQVQSWLSEVAEQSSAVVNRSGQIAVEVKLPGLTAISYEALGAAGFALHTANPANLHLERAGVEVATEWVGDGDDAFEKGEKLLFYAEPRFSRWSDHDVYFLSLGASPPLRIGERSAGPISTIYGSQWVERLFEENTLYTPDCYCAPIPVGRDGDRWAWDVLRQPDRASADYSFSLDAVDINQEAFLTIWLIGYTDIREIPDHRVEILINGISLGTREFNDKTAWQGQLAIPPGVLREAGNRLTITLPGVGSVVEGVWLDAFSVRYARNVSRVEQPFVFTGEPAASQYTIQAGVGNHLQIYDVTSSDRPNRVPIDAAGAGDLRFSDPSDLLPRRYLVVPFESSLEPARVRQVDGLSPAGGGDLIVISPQEFIPDLAELVALRQSQGWRVVVEDVASIYDAADGRAQPEAIHAYIQQAYHTWNPRPLAVILVGDGTVDPRQYRDGSSATWIPPFLADVDLVIGETAADNRYGTVDGEDNLPDVWIGRLPVNSHVEAAILVTKIVQYERNPTPGQWSQNFLLVADKKDPTAGDFPFETSALANQYQAGRYRITSLVQNASMPANQLHQEILNHWNSGNGLVFYHGHGSTHQWGADRLLHINDLPALVNGGRLPVVLEMTCLTGSFHISDMPTLDETLLRRSGKGAVAVWGSTGLGLSSGHVLLARGFLDQVMSDGQAAIGQAVLAGQINLVAQAPMMGYMIDTFGLLGDPTLTIGYRYNSYVPTIRH